MTVDSDSNAVIEGKPSVSSYWWLPILLLGATLPVLIAIEVLFLVAPLFEPLLAALDVVMSLLILFILGLTVFSPVAVYFDRKYVTALSEWKPSRIYFLMVIPAFFTNLLLAVLYIYQRHKHLGIP